MLTATQLSAKRSKRNSASRSKSKQKSHDRGEFIKDQALSRQKATDALAAIGLAQQHAADELRMTLATRQHVPKPSQNMLGRIGSFFKPRGR